MTITTLSSLAIYMIVSSFTPGPGNILALNTMTRYGWKKGQNLFIGICMGYLCVQTICAVAVFSFVRALDGVLNWLKWIGALYLIFLAIKILISKPDFTSQDKAPSFWTGFIMQFANVKIFLYGITVLSGYILPYDASIVTVIVAQLFVVAVGSLATFMWGLLGLKLKSLYARYYRLANVSFCVMLVYCAWSMVSS